MKFVKNRKIIIEAVLFTVFFVFIGIFVYRDSVVHAYISGFGGSGSSGGGSGTPSPTLGTWNITTTTSTSSPVASPSSVDNTVSTTVTVTDVTTTTTTYTCPDLAGCTGGNLSGTSSVTNNLGSCTISGPEYSPFVGLQSDGTNSCYGASVSIIPRYGKYTITIQQTTPSSDSTFYIEQHNYTNWIIPQPQSVTYTTTVSCTPGGWKNACNPNDNNGYIGITLNSGPESWLSLSDQSLQKTGNSQQLSNCDTTVCSYSFGVTAYSVGLASGVYNADPAVDVCYSETAYRGCSGFPSSANLNSHNPSYTSIQTNSTIVLNLIIFSSWMNVTKGGNAYSPKGYNLDNSTYSTSPGGGTGSTGSPFLLGGLIEYTSSIGNFLNTSSQQSVSVNRLNLLSFNRTPVYDFNFFATLYCQFTPNCGTTTGVYYDGVLQPSNIANSSPTTCSSSGANWYYSSTDLPNSSSLCSSNDIVLVNSNVTISGNLQGINNLLIISSGNITIQGGVSTVNAFLMAMGKIIILN